MRSSKVIFLSKLTACCFWLYSFGATTCLGQNSFKNIMREWHDYPLSLFVHWGPVSLIGKEISWSREEFGKARYDSLYLRFNPNNFNALDWVKMAKNNGFNQIVLTAKHHDGFCMWNTKTTSYNIMHTPFGRDICKELAEAAHSEGLKIGWYFSPGDWKDLDCRNPKTNDVFVKRMLVQLKELLASYGKIDVLWIDYDGWVCPVDPKIVYDLARKLQPGIIINNRLEALNPDESHVRVGQNSNYATPEGFVPGYGDVPWETSTNMGTQWAWKFNDQPRSLKECIQTYLRCIGGNGNLLFNIGPDSLGNFPQSFQQRLLEMGRWLKQNSQAVHKTLGGPYLPSTDYVSTHREDSIFLYFLSDTLKKMVLPPLPAKVKSARSIDGTNISFTQSPENLIIELPPNADSIASIVQLTIESQGKQVPPIYPFSASGSLAYAKNACASSQIGSFLHNAGSAFDDNMRSGWKLGRKSNARIKQMYGKKLHFLNDSVINVFQHKGWLMVDLGKARIVNRVELDELVYDQSGINDFAVQYQQKGEWKTFVRSNKMGHWSSSVRPTCARRFRVLIYHSYGYPGIAEFRLFGPPNKN